MVFTTSDLGGNALRVALTGRLDPAATAAIETQMTAQVVGAGKPTAFDLTGLEFTGSLGIRLILSVARVLQRRGLKVVVFGAHGVVAEVLSTVGLDAILPVLPDQAAAEAALAA
ncbi:STAS domain-containing protein [Acetobacteraceae bacterium H6797]|nr:STAS domain-containing protein [Acetobacteraceae bacterium H6797]